MAGIKYAGLWHAGYYSHNWLVTETTIEVEVQRGAWKKNERGSLLEVTISPFPSLFNGRYIYIYFNGITWDNCKFWILQ